MSITQNVIDDITDPVVAFFSGDTWAVIGHGGLRWSGVNSIHPIPAVDCPIIDTTTVVDEQKFSQVLRRTIHPKSIDVGDLLEGAKNSGATIFIPSIAKEMLHV